MSNHIGLDVSLKTTAIWIMDIKEKILKELVSSTYSQDIVSTIMRMQILWLLSVEVSATGVSV